MPLLPVHPDARIIRAQLRQNLALRQLTTVQWAELEAQLEIEDYPKGDTLEYQGDHSMEQYFILDGILKRVVSNAEGKEMILRFAAETDIDTSYAAWRLKTPIPYSIRTVTRVRAAKLSMQQWVSFLERHPAVKTEFDFEIMKLMSEVMAHTITLHLLDASGRVLRFMRKHPDLPSGCRKRSSPRTSISRPRRCRVSSDGARSDELSSPRPLRPPQVCGGAPASG
jgi:CRP-like cAMP-binding protein